MEEGKKEEEKVNVYGTRYSVSSCQRKGNIAALIGTRPDYDNMLMKISEYKDRRKYR